MAAPKTYTALCEREEERKQAQVYDALKEVEIGARPAGRGSHGLGGL